MRGNICGHDPLAFIAANFLTKISLNVFHLMFSVDERKSVLLIYSPVSPSVIIVFLMQ